MIITIKKGVSDEKILKLVSEMAEKGIEMRNLDARL